MIRSFTAIALLLALPAFGLAQQKKDPTAEILAKLRSPCDLNVAGTIPLGELTELIGKRHEIPVIVNNTAYQNLVGEAPTDSAIKLPKAAKGLPLSTVLKTALAEKGSTYLVRRTHIEIVPIGAAAKEAKIPASDEDGFTHLTQPLISAIYKEKPLNEALADLAEENDLTIVVAPQAGDNKIGFVSARLLNVPADKAIELIAVQADLRVVKKANGYLITSGDHAAELFNEEIERKQKKLELERPAVGGLIGMPPTK
jgi:hypothetical protein